MRFFSKVILVILLFTSCTEKNQSPACVFNHISLHVSDLEKSEAFYATLFELDPIPDPFPAYRVTWFSLGNETALHLFEDAGAIPATGKYHLCFSVRSITEFIQKLDASDILYYDSKRTPRAVTVRPDHVSQIYFDDPDGHRIEVNDANKLY